LLESALPKKLDSANRGAFMRHFLTREQQLLRIVKALKELRKVRTTLDEPGRGTVDSVIERLQAALEADIHWNHPEAAASSPAHLPLAGEAILGSPSPLPSSQRTDSPRR
jgi:hypothetical protein